MGKLKNWFFKGRIEKNTVEQKRIELLSKEYDEGKILKIGKE
jgi:hypothetical protein